MKNQVLVTGGTGYIGSHTVVELQNEGFEVVIIDDLSNSLVGTLEGIEKITGIKPHFEQFNLTDKQKVTEFFTKYPRINSIIHFAAHKAVGESVNLPLKYYRNNLVSLLNLLEAMQVYSVSYFVFSSSCTVYGQPGKLPVTEAAPVQKAISPYGNTKQIAEEIIQDAIVANDAIKALALRYFNPIGAHKSALIGELPLGVPDNLVPYITQTVYGIREQLKVFGNDYNTPDGSCIRDYIHVVDLAKAHVVAIKRLIEQKNKTDYEFFNLGTGRGYSVLELLNTFEEVTGKKVNHQIVDRRPGDIEQIWADTKLANEELGWKTELSLAEMLESAYNWEVYYRENIQ